MVIEKTAPTALKLHGIKSCDTMRKARSWLDAHGIRYIFHDYKSEGIGREALQSWSTAVGWETLLNRSGTTFRKLPESDKTNIGEREAIALMLAQSSLIKRPVLQQGGVLIVGFAPEKYAAALGHLRAAAD